MEKQQASKANHRGRRSVGTPTIGWLSYVFVKTENVKRTAAHYPTHALG